MQLVYLLMTLFLVSDSGEVLVSNDETTIIIEEGRAYLAEIDDAGKVLKKFIEVPEYFESEKSHEEKVEAAKKKYEILKKHQIDQIRFVPFDGSFDRLDEAAVANLHHVAGHYRQTYANDILVTAAKRNGNAQVLDKMIADIVFVLRSLDVAQEDITVEYKYDKGDEPLQFVKIQSRLK